MKLNNKIVTITGGTGSLGYGLAKRLLPICKEVRIFSRDESKQLKMKDVFPKCKFVLGDVRDYYSIREAIRGTDVIIHAAAFKFLDLSEIQPTECVLSNVVGSINVVRAAKEEGVKMVMGISTDKVPYARNVYGCTKQIMERLFEEANNQKETKFLICRYGNVVGTTGSVIPHWKKLVEKGEDLVVTNKKMRRFFFTLDAAVDLVLSSIEKEDKFLNYTEMKVVSLWRMAKIIADGKVGVKEGELRAGEKLDEVLVADYEGGELSTRNSEQMTDAEIKELVEKA